MKNKSKKQINELTYQIVGAAIDIHKELGPGLLENVYERCMKFELNRRELNFQSQYPVEVNYKGTKLGTNLRLDLLVENSIAVELKTIEDFAPVHTAQILTYMKLSNAYKGILINFYCQTIYKEGIRTFVNEKFAALPDL